MRIKFIDRLLAAISGLVLVCGSLCLVGVGVDYFFARTLISDVSGKLLSGNLSLLQRLSMLGVALVLLGLGIHGLSLLFRRRKDKGFVMQHTEMGDMSISMHAMESMVKRCIDTHEELKVTHTRIHRVKDGVAVDIRVSLANGVNIPLTVNALQKQIKHYITSCSGVDVKAVRVMVETDNHQKPKSAEVIAPDLVAAEASATVQAQDGFGGAVETELEKDPIHQRIFRHEEQEQLVPPPPAEEEMAAEESALAEAEDVAVEKMGESETETTEADEDALMDEESPEEDAFHEDTHFENILVKEDEEENA